MIPVMARKRASDFVRLQEQVIQSLINTADLVGLRKSLILTFFVIFLQKMHKLTKNEFFNQFFDFFS